MRTRLLILLTLGLTWACSQGIVKQEQTHPASEETHVQPLPPPDIASEFDLGGPCLEKDPNRRMPRTFWKEPEFRKEGNWGMLIESMKELVRDDCAIAHRWGQLFTAVVDGGRYADALKLANDMMRRGYALPHGFLARANPRFLESIEFQNSELGKKYAARQMEILETLHRAEQTLASMKDLPSNPFRSRDACPGEYCAYGKWRTTQAIELRESIASTTIVARIPAQTNVTAVTGDVLVEPQPYAVLEDFGPVLKAGDVIFFLDYVGEGVVNYWYNGQLKPDLGLEDGLDGLTTYSDVSDCAPGAPRGACALRNMRPEKDFLNQWWVKVRTADGKEGWVQNTGQLMDIDESHKRAGSNPVPVDARAD